VPDTREQRTQKEAAAKFISWIIWFLPEHSLCPLLTHTFKRLCFFVAAIMAFFLLKNTELP
jgi:hypothetical protein